MRDSHFFEKVKEIVLMGGITSPPVFEKKVMEGTEFFLLTHRRQDRPSQRAGMFP